MTIGDLTSNGGKLDAYCLTCKSWRRVPLKPLQGSWTVVEASRRLRCKTCRQPPAHVHVADRYHNAATLRL